MKRLIIVAIVILSLPAFSDHEQRPAALLLDVRSAGIPVSVAFEAAWLTETAAGRQLNFMQGTTPAEFKIAADSLTAIFSKRSGLTELRVRLFRLRDGEKQPMLMGEGRIITIFGNSATWSVSCTSLE